MKIDMHIHTKYSGDSLLSFNTIMKICKKKNITPIITDHDTMKFALKFKKYFPIMGEEISTTQGHITGLFLNEEIPANLSPAETVDLIKQQDGIIYIPHPFDRLRRSTLKILNLPIDIVEIFNSRTVFKEDDKKALQFAKEKNLLMGVGSDAHFKYEIGNAYIIIDEFNSKKEFLRNLKNAKYFCKKSSVLVHPLTKIIKKILK